MLRGWGAYFRNGNSDRKFNAVDGYVHERLAILASRKSGPTAVAWALPTGQDLDATTLVRALGTWFGQPA